MRERGIGVENVRRNIEVLSGREKGVVILGVVVFFGVWVVVGVGVGVVLVVMRSGLFEVDLIDWRVFYVLGVNFF